MSCRDIQYMRLAIYYILELIFYIKRTILVTKTHYLVLRVISKRMIRQHDLKDKSRASYIVDKYIYYAGRVYHLLLHANNIAMMDLLVSQKLYLYILNIPFLWLRL